MFDIGRSRHDMSESPTIQPSDFRVADLRQLSGVPSCSLGPGSRSLECSTGTGSGANVDQHFTKCRATPSKDQAPTEVCACRRGLEDA